MSSTSVDKLTPNEIQQLSLSYAAFILSDAGAKVNAQTLQSVLDAAGIKTEKLWIDLFSKTLASKPVDSFFSTAGGASSSGPAPASTPAAGGKGDKKDEKKDEKKDDKKAGKKDAPAPEPAPAADEDVDMGGLFDF